MAGEAPGVSHGCPALLGHDKTTKNPIRVTANRLGELSIESGAESGTFTYAPNGLVSTIVNDYTKDGSARTKTITFTFDGSNRIATFSKVIA